MFCMMTGVNGCSFDLLGCASLIYGVGAVPNSSSARPVARPNFVGTDGSQTRSASFLGNFTTITQPSQTYFAMQRQSDCSLSLITGTANLSSGSVTVTGTTPHYERTLHQLASLTTTGGSYPLGCVEKNTGISSRPGVWVGNTTQGIGIFAGAAPNGDHDSTFTITLASNKTGGRVTVQSSLTNASGVATADINGDGNGDLVAVNGAGNPSSAFISVMLGNADGTFSSPVSYSIPGAKSMAAVIDDINNDGKLDIIASSDTQQISVLSGKGDGTFNAAQSFSVTSPGATPSTINNLITADLRGNGRKDIIGANGLVLLNNGDGTFTATPGFPYTASSTSNGPNVVSGDINGDGKLDLVVGTGSILQTYLGRGDGTFTVGNGYATIDNVGYVTLSDLDGDGNLDIYTGLANGGLYSGDDSENAAAYVLMGNGNGSFQGAPALPASFNGTNLGDIDGDGNPDIITLTGTTFTAYLSKTSGGFKPTSTIQMPATVTVGGTTYPTAGFPVGTYAVADMNGDSKADLVFVSGLTDYANTNQPIFFVALSNGDGTFATPVGRSFNTIATSVGLVFDNNATITGLHVADFDRDGRNDLQVTFNEIATSGPGLTFTQRYLQGFLIVPGNGDATFKHQSVTVTYNDATQPSFFNPPQVASVTDINADLKPDLVAVARTGSAGTGFGSQVQIFLGNGDDTFKAPTTPSTAANPPLPSSSFSALSPVVLADLNADGKLDLITMGETKTFDSQLGISLGNGDGTFGTAAIYKLTGGDTVSSSGLAAADFDGDGKLDVAVTSLISSSNGIFFGKGDGTLNYIDTGSGSAIPKDLINLGTYGPAIAADFNHDGKPDLLVSGTLLINAYGSTPVLPTLAATTTTLTASASTIPAGSSLTLTATVTPTIGSTGTPSGKVTFLDGTNILGNGTLVAGKATFTSSGLAVGSHAVTATYAGDMAFQTSTSSSVTISVTTTPLPIDTSTTLSTSATSAVTGTSLTFTAIVTPVSGSVIPSGTITFSDGATIIGPATLDATGRATLSTSGLGVGSHSIKAIYPGSSAFSPSTSAAIAVTITVMPPTGDFALNFAQTGSTITHGNTASATLSITPSGGFNQTIALSCSGAPAHTTCTISPSSITPSGSAASTATVTLQTDVKTASVLARNNVSFAVLIAAGLFGMGLRCRRRTFGLLCLGACTLLASVSLTGCGGSTASSTTPTGSYSITVTATAGSITHTAAYNLTVQ